MKRRRWAWALSGNIALSRARGSTRDAKINPSFDFGIALSNGFSARSTPMRMRVNFAEFAVQYSFPLSSFASRSLRARGFL